MAKRHVSFTVDDSGKVLPSIPQYGGVRGEHHATAVSFTVPMPSVYTEGDTVRITFTAGDGAVLSSDLIEDLTVLDSGIQVTYVLPKIVTLCAGQLCMRLVLSQFDENDDETVMFQSEEAVLYFDEAAMENGTPFWTGVSEMLKRTTTAKEATVLAQEAASAANGAAQTAREEAVLAAAEAAGYASQTQTDCTAVRHAAAVVEQNCAQAEEYAASGEEAALRSEAAAEVAKAAVESEGRRGPEGLSAYEVAVANGFEGDEAAWLASLKGEKGDDGTIPAGGMVFKGDTVGSALENSGERTVGNVYHVTTDDSYRMWNGEAWVAIRPSISETVAENITRAVSGAAVYTFVKENAVAGADGNGIASAQLNADYTLTLTFTDGSNYTTSSIRGEQGHQGKSAYEIAMDYGEYRTEEEWLEGLKGKSAYEVAVANGFEGDEAAWLASIKGEQGDPYTLTDEDRAAIVADVLAALPAAEGVAL